MKGEISLNTLCDRLKLNIPAVLEMAIDGKLPLWIRLNDVDILTEKNNSRITRQKITVRPDMEVLSALSRMERGKGTRQKDIERNWEIVHQKMNKTYTPPTVWPYLETYPLMSGPLPTGEFDPVPKKEVVLYTAMLAYNENNQRIAVTTEDLKTELEIRPSDLFAYLSDVELLENKHFTLPGQTEQPDHRPIGGDDARYTLVGKPAIAKHTGMSESWVRDQLKNGMPHKKLSNRRVAACPEELDARYAKKKNVS